MHSSTTPYIPMKWYTKQLQALEKNKSGKKKIADKKNPTAANKVTVAEALRARIKPTTRIVKPIDTRNRSRPKTDLY